MDIMMDISVDISVDIGVAVTVVAIFTPAVSRAHIAGENRADEKREDGNGRTDSRQDEGNRDVRLICLVTKWSMQASRTTGKFIKNL